MKLILEFIKNKWNNLILIFLILSSCIKEENITPTKDKYNIDIGSYSLLIESLKIIPYNNKNKIIFKDSSNNSVILGIQEQELYKSNGSYLIRYDVYDKGDTVKYHYSSEIKSFIIKNDSLRIRFELILEAKPYYPDPEKGYVADVTSIIYFDPDPPRYGYEDFYDETNKITWPSLWSNPPLPQKELLGKLFYNVLNINFINPKTVIYFNYEFGIISFTDNEKKKMEI